MPQGNNNPAPPEVMTWGRAAPVIIGAAVFDVLGLMFEGLVFFGPALVGAYCATTVGGVWVIGKLLAAGCAAGAIAAGTAASVALIGFGEMMAIAIGLVGWLAVGLYLAMTNRRIFKENTLWFAGSLLLTEIPLLGALPFVSFIVWRMYSRQIRTEEAALKEWEKKQAAIQAQERNQRIAEVIQIRNFQRKTAEEQEEREQHVAEVIQISDFQEKAAEEQKQNNGIPKGMKKAA